MASRQVDWNGGGCVEVSCAKKARFKSVGFSLGSCCRTEGSGGIVTVDVVGVWIGNVGIGGVGNLTFFVVVVGDAAFDLFV